MSMKAKMLLMLMKQMLKQAWRSEADVSTVYVNSCLADFLNLHRYVFTLIHASTFYKDQFDFSTSLLLNFFMKKHYLVLVLISSNRDSSCSLFISNFLTPLRNTMQRNSSKLMQIEVNWCILDFRALRIQPL